jgi:anti-sigma B factor antagonist
MSELESVAVRSRDQFAIVRRQLEHGIVLAVSGEIDLATAPTIEGELLDVEKAHRLVAIDLSQVSFVDSTGLRVILGADSRLRDAGGRLLIVQGPSQVRRLFEVTGLTNHLDILRDEAELERLVGRGNEARSS